MPDLFNFFFKMLLSSTLISLIFVLVASIGSCVNSTGVEEDATQPSQQETEQPPQQPQQGPQQLPHIIQPSLNVNHFPHIAWQFPQHAQLSPYIQHQFPPQHQTLPIDMQSQVPQPTSQNNAVPINDALRHVEGMSNYIKNILNSLQN
jgi:hypothetical protein